MSALSSGTPVVMLHGWGIGRAVWNPLRRMLPRGVPVAAPDLPGYGANPAPTAGYGLDQVAQALTTHVCGPAVWKGWSLGGLLALAVALSRPDLVAGLVLVATTPRFLRGPDWAYGLDPAELEGLAHQIRHDRTRVLRRFAALQTRGMPDPRPVLRVLRRAAEVPAAPEVLSGGLALLTSVDLRDRLQEVRAPVLFLLGERDTLVPKGLEDYLVRRRPDWPVQVLPGTGHAPFLTHPRVVLSALEAVALGR